MTYKPKIFCGWNLKSNFDYEIPIEIYVDRIVKHPLPIGIIRIIQIQESHNTQHVIEFIQKNTNMYNYVFTYYDEIIKNNPKAHKFMCINTWIKNYLFPDKVFGVSTLVGGKKIKNLLGHELRHNLWERRKEIKTPKHFYLSSQNKYNKGDYKKNLILKNKKEPLFDTMFHIAIENASINNMFTEKLIDCFQTKTIPIYWGADNIGEYFNIDGMLIGKDVDELIKLANNITPELYKNKILAIEENYIKSMNYVSHTQILDRKLSEILNKK